MDAILYLRAKGIFGASQTKGTVKLKSGKTFEIVKLLEMYANCQNLDQMAKKDKKKDKKVSSKENQQVKSRATKPYVPENTKTKSL